MHDMGSFQQVIYSLSFGVYQATSMVAVTSVSTLLPSYFQNINTAVKLEECKAACVLLLLFFCKILFLKIELPNTPLYINLLLPNIISFTDEYLSLFCNFSVWVRYAFLSNIFFKIILMF